MTFLNVGEYMNKNMKLIAILLFSISLLIGCTSDYQGKDSDQNKENHQTRTMEGGESELIPTDISSQLSFDDFKERWNSYVQEQMTNLEINKLEGITDEVNHYYRARLTDQIELRILEDQHLVQRLEIHSNGTSHKTIRKMLTAWSHVVNIMHQEIEFHDVDALFHEIGVKPNFDVSNVKEKTFTKDGITYEILPIEDGFIFKASYQ